MLFLSGSVAELADAQDLKSCGSQIPYRFDSGFRHQFFMEEYPSPVEGIGLENREVVQAAQGFESLFLRQFCYRGIEQPGSSLGS